MCLTEKTYNPAAHLLHLCKKVVKKIPIYLEYFDDNRDILSPSEGTYLGLMNTYKNYYDDCLEISPGEVRYDIILDERQRKVLYDFMAYVENGFDKFERLHQEHLARVYLYKTADEEEMEVEVVTINGVEYLYDPKTDDIFDYKEYELTGYAIILGKYADLK